MLSAIIDIVNVIGTVIELLAVGVIAYASLEAFISLIRFLFTQMPVEDRRMRFLRFLRLLVLGLTFELAADLVHIAIARSWEEIGHVAVIAGLRTFLAFFLDRDMRQASEEQDLA